VLAAGHLEEASESAVEGIASAVHQEPSGKLLAGVARFVSTRTAEGVANGWLMARFGHLARRLLRPIS
jgi:uncharacterized membrane protein YcjF (UPF0283 family)